MFILSSKFLYLINIPETVFFVEITPCEILPQKNKEWFNPRRKIANRLDTLTDNKGDLARPVNRRTDGHVH